MESDRGDFRRDIGKILDGIGAGEATRRKVEENLPQIEKLLSGLTEKDVRELVSKLGGK